MCSYCCAIDPVAEDAAYSEPGVILTKEGQNLAPATVIIIGKFPHSSISFCIEFLA